MYTYIYTSTNTRKHTHITNKNHIHSTRTYVYIRLYSGLYYETLCLWFWSVSLRFIRCLIARCINARRDVETNETVVGERLNDKIHNIIMDGYENQELVLLTIGFIFNVNLFIFFLHLLSIVSYFVSFPIPIVIIIYLRVVIAPDTPCRHRVPHWGGCGSIILSI